MESIRDDASGGDDQEDIMPGQSNEGDNSVTASNEDSGNSPMSIDQTEFEQVNQFYEERDTKNAGIGMFATVTILAGTRVICEEATVVLPDESDILDLYKAVEEISPHAREEFWKLVGSTKQHEVDWISQLRANYDGQSEEFDDLVDKHEKAWSIYETNRFTVKSPSGYPDSMGIFTKAARMNHSCAPNVFHRYNAFVHRLTVHALRTIAPGEELLTSYIDICHPTLERRRILRHWGFKCRCSACVSKDHVQDFRRKKLEDGLARMKKSEMKRAMENWQQWDYAKALSHIEEVLGWMDEEGMEESDTLGEALANAAEYAMALGWWDLAKGWAERGLEVERKCCGTDSQEYERAKVLVEATKGR